MDKKDPYRQLSRTVQRAYEGSARLDAIEHGHPWVNFTYGHLASQLVEAGVVEPDVNEVAKFLNVTPEDFREASLHGSKYLEFVLKTNWRDAYKASAKPEIAAFDVYLDEKLAKYEDENGTQKADALEAELIKAYSDYEVSRTPKEEKSAYQRLFTLEQKKIAYNSGLVVPFEDLVQIACDYESNSGMTPNELACALEKLVCNITNFNKNIEDIPLENIYLGKDEIEIFRRIAAGMHSARASAFAENRWNKVRPFVLVSPEEYSLLYYNR